MYRVTTPIFDKAWGADEELLLLEAIEQHGYGNWSSIAQHIGNNKTKEACEKHYNTVYLTKAGAIGDPPLPDQKRDLVDTMGPNGIPPNQGTKGNYKTGKDKHRAGTFSAILGTMTKRRDFDHEWCEAAEEVVRNIKFEDTDTPLERTFKLEMLRQYGRVVDGRYERKELIFRPNSSFLNPKIINARKTKTKEQKDTLRELQVFARYFDTHDAYLRFADGILEEQTMRESIAHLQMLLHNGVTTIADGEEFNRRRKYGAVGGTRLLIPGSTKRQRVSRPHRPNGSELLGVMEDKKRKELGLTVGTYMAAKHKILVEGAATWGVQRAPPAAGAASQASGGRGASVGVTTIGEFCAAHKVSPEVIQRLVAWFKSRGWLFDVGAAAPQPSGPAVS